MSFTVASKTGITKFVLGLLNASSAYAAVTDDDKFTDGLVAEAVFQGDERFYTAGAETKGHWMRPEIMDWSTDVTTQNAETPVHIGELGEVRIKYVSTDSDYKLGKSMTAQELEIYRRNTDSSLNANHNATGTLVAGYYNRDALLDGVCDFTGYALGVRVATYTRTSSLQSPEAYSSGIAAHALAELFSMDGLDPNLAAYYARQADGREALVRGNARVLAELSQTAQAG